MSLEEELLGPTKNSIEGTPEPTDSISLSDFTEVVSNLYGGKMVSEIHPEKLIAHLV